MQEPLEVRPPTAGSIEGPSGVDLEQVDLERDPDEQFEEHLGIAEIIQGLTIYPQFQIDLL